MVRVEGEIVIWRPVEEVFDVIADPCTEPRYNPVMLHVDKLTPGPVRVGSLFQNVHRALGGSGTMLVEVTKLDRPHRVATTAHGSSMDVTGTVTTQPVPGGTRLLWSWQVRPVGWFRLLTPVLALAGRRLERRTWLGLKSYLERTEALPPEAADDERPAPPVTTRRR